MSEVLHAPPVAQAGVGRVIAVAAGRGGVGKTWFAISLARALVLAGRRVLLYDGDPSGGNVDAHLGMMPEHDLCAFLDGSRSAADCAALYPAGGFSVLAGRCGPQSTDPLDLAKLAKVLPALSTNQDYDNIVVDLGAGLDRPVRCMAAWAHALLVVATEEAASQTDAYAVLKYYCKDRPDGDARLVVNQAITTASGMRTYKALARASAQHLGCEPPLAGIIRRDDRVREAVRKRVLLQVCAPRAQAVLDVDALTGGLLGRHAS